MREDQYLRLQKLEEQLTEQFLMEADPSNWAGDKVIPRDMTQHERGDRYWCKKNAVATISLTMRIGSLMGMIQRRDVPPAPANGDDEDESQGLLDQEVAAAEREAKKMLAKVSHRASAKTP